MPIRRSKAPEPPPSASPARDLEVIATVDGMRALSDPVRLEMVRRLTLEPQTGSALARALGIPANRAHYHLRRLLDAGLIRDASGEREGSTEERFFTASARHIVVDPGIGAVEGRATAALRRSVDATFSDWRRSQVLDIEWDDLARIVVHRSLGIDPSDTVLVFFAPITLEAAEAILLEVERCGARAHLRSWSRNVILRTLDPRTPEELEALPLIPPELDASLTAVVFLTSSLPQGAPPTPEQQAKLPHLLRSVSAWKESVRNRGLRYLHLGLPHRGEFAPGYLGPEAGIDTFWRCVSTDPEEMRARGERLLRRALQDPQVRIEGTDGTTLTVELDPERIGVSDGVLSDKSGTARASGSVPAGALVAIPRSGTGDGTFLADYTFAGGRHFRDVRVVLRAGRIVELDGPEGIDALRERIAREAGDPDLLSAISVGLNPGGTGPTGRPELDSVLAGVVTLDFGNNELLGGTVRSTFNLSLPSHRCTVRSGPQPLVVRGRLADHDDTLPSGKETSR